MLCWLLGPTWAKMAPRDTQEPPRPPQNYDLGGFWGSIFINFSHVFMVFFYTYMKTSIYYINKLIKIILWYSLLLYYHVFNPRLLLLLRRWLLVMLIVSDVLLNRKACLVSVTGSFKNKACLTGFAVFAASTVCILCTISWWFSISLCCCEGTVAGRPKASG